MEKAKRAAVGSCLSSTSASSHLFLLTVLALLTTMFACQPAKEASNETAQVIEETLQARDNAALIAALQNMEATRRAAELYRAERGQLPQGLEGLTDVGADHPLLQEIIGRYENLSQILSAFEGQRFSRVEVIGEHYRFVAQVKGSDRFVEATPQRVGEAKQGNAFEG